MKEKPRHIQTDLAIIGTGMAGISAAVFALNRNLSCTLTGNTGALAYTTGYLDLFGSIGSKFVDNPWDGIKELSEEGDNHPLAGIAPENILAAFGEFISFISSSGLSYSIPGSLNLRAITPAGTVKPTLCVPGTMMKGVRALQNKASCIIFGFRGLKGFSARQIAANLKSEWPTLQAKVISFPGHEHGELYAEVAARTLEVPGNRARFAELIKKEAAGSDYVGLPAILGMHSPDTVMADLEKLTGLKIFEIPTIPPSVPGIRLRETIEQILPARGVNLIPQQKIKKVRFTEKNLRLELSDNHGPISIEARSVLLATGRFLSGGLEAHFDRISEPLIDLPVHQPASREEWYHEQYLDTRGHNIHLAGIQTDNFCRPLGRDGRVFDERLFAAGIVLAHQDWIRQRCGAGVAIATAYEAVEAAATLLAR